MFANHEINKSARKGSVPHIGRKLALRSHDRSKILIISQDNRKKQSERQDTQPGNFARHIGSNIKDKQDVANTSRFVSVYFRSQVIVCVWKRCSSCKLWFYDAWTYKFGCSCSWTERSVQQIHHQGWLGRETSIRATFSNRINPSRFPHPSSRNARWPRRWKLQNAFKRTSEISGLSTEQTKGIYIYIWKIKTCSLLLGVSRRGKTYIYIYIVTVIPPFQFISDMSSTPYLRISVTHGWMPKSTDPVSVSDTKFSVCFFLLFTPLWRVNVKPEQKMY